MTDVSSWINKGQPRSTWPEWLERHAPTRAEANGSFLIKTKLGQARVHSGAMVFEYAGHAYTCHPAEAKAQLDTLRLADAPPPPTPNAKGRTQGPKVEAEIADLRDDTDDITARLRGALAPVKEVVAASRALPKPAAGSKIWPKTKGMPPSIENRHPAELNIDDSYQRSTDTGPSRALIAKIAREWDWRMCMPLVVSKRADGSLWVLDGQHRLAGALMRGDIPFLPCCVGVYANVADEAAMFVAMNRARRPINRLDDFHAAQAGDDPEALAIAALITGVGFTVSRRTGSASWVPGEVAFTSAIAKVRRKHGDGVAQRALALMADAFAGQRLTAGSSVFTAICRILVFPPPHFEDGKLLLALKTFDMPGWASFLAGAKGGDDRDARLRAMLLEAYADVTKELAA